MWFLFYLSVRWQQKSNFPFFTLMQILAIKKTRRSGFFRKLFSAGAEAN